MPDNKRSILPPWPSYLFTLIALVALVTLVRVKSMADTAIQNVSVDPEPPVVENIVALDQEGSDIVANHLIPIEGGTNTVTVSGVVNDPNGCSDIDTVTIKIYRVGVGAGASDAQSNHYTHLANISNCSGGNDVNADFSYSFPMTNFIDPTDTGTWADDEWQIDVTAVDKTVGTPNSASLAAIFEVNSLSAFNTSESIDYNVVSLGGYSVEKPVVFTNTGNRNVDAMIIATSTHGGDMVEPSGNFAVIPVGNVHYSLTQGFTYGVDDAAVVGGNGPAELFAIHLPKQTLDLPGNIPEVTTYWKLRMPDSGVNGTYSNTLNLTATAY